MKSLAISTAIVLAIALIGCKQSRSRGVQNGGAKPIDARAQDIADLKALEDRFTKAFRAKDVNAIMELCVADDSLVVFDVHPPLEYRGPQAYRKDWEDVFSQFAGPVEVGISEMDVAAGDDVGYAHYVHRVTGTTKTGKKQEIAVRVTDCFKKVDGKWLIAHSHISVPVDMRTGKADFESKP